MAALACSLTFILCSPLIYVTGFICGRFSQSHKRLEPGLAPPINGRSVQPNDTLKEGYALNENAAYDSVQATSMYAYIHA